MEQTLRDILRVLNQMNDRRSRLRTAFLEGIIRGIGAMIGFAVVGTALLLLLKSVAQANLPVISDFLAQVVTMVQLGVQ